MVTMKPPDWVADAVFYQIFPDRFNRAGETDHPRPSNQFEPWEDPPTVRGFKGGDLAGVVEKLDYLADLGVGAIYLNPVFASSANHRYHTSDYFRVDPLLGGDAALKRLLGEAHARGMKVILDGVFNHTGRGFFAFQHLLENGSASPYRDWYYTGGFPLRAYEESPNYEAWWGNPELPKLRVETPEVRDYLLTVAEHWISFGADGWRLDVPQEIADIDFWMEFRERVKNTNPEAYLVGEIWHEAADWVVPHGPFDALMNYPLARAVLGFAGGEELDGELASRSGLGSIDPLDGAAWLERLTTLFAHYPEEVNIAQLGLVSSHDTPRLFSMLREDARRVALALELVIFLPGVPTIYYGDEVALPGAHDPDNRRAFPWGQVRFEDCEVWKRVRRALHLRGRYEQLRRGGFIPLYASGNRVAFNRGADVMVTANAQSVPWELDVPCKEGTPGELRGLVYGGRIGCSAGRLRGAGVPDRAVEVWVPYEGI